MIPGRVCSQGGLLDLESCNMSPKPILSPARRACVAAALCLGTALTIIDGSIVNVALPSIGHDFCTSTQHMIYLE